jgi:hypothetical protein
MKRVGEEEEKDEEEDKWKVLDQVPTTSHLVKKPQTTHFCLFWALFSDFLR